MNFIIYAVIAIALLGTVYEGVHYVSDNWETTAGIKKGEANKQAEWDAANRKAEGEARAKEAADKLVKDTADAENKAAISSLNDTIGKLRAESDRRRAAFLPATPAATPSSDTACFDRPQYLGAYGSLVEGLRGLANEGSGAVTDLESAKKWAQK